MSVTVTKSNLADVIPSIPTVSTVLSNLQAWQQFCNQLGSIVKQAECENQKQLDKAKNVGEWTYHSVLDKNIDAVLCANEECTQNFEPDARGYYQNVNQNDAFFCSTCFLDRNRLLALHKKYDSETWRDKAERASDQTEWYFQRLHDGKTSRHAVMCLFEGDCWYQGNLDRLDEHEGSYFLRGCEQQVAMCEVCWNNQGAGDSQVERCIKREFQTDDEKRKEKQKIKTHKKQKTG